MEDELQLTLGAKSSEYECLREMILRLTSQFDQLDASVTELKDNRGRGTEHQLELAHLDNPAELESRFSPEFFVSPRDEGVSSPLSGSTGLGIFTGEFVTGLILGEYEKERGPGHLSVYPGKHGKGLGYFPSQLYPPGLATSVSGPPSRVALAEQQSMRMSRWRLTAPVIHRIVGGACLAGLVVCSVAAVIALDAGAYFFVAPALLGVLGTTLLGVVNYLGSRETREN